MDVFAHGLWAGAAYKALNKTLRPAQDKRRLSIKWAVFWGIFPDLFAFAIPFVWLFWNLAFGGLSWKDLPRPEATEPPHQRFWIFNLASSLYSVGHSSIIFFAVFFLVWLFLRRPFWELGGWLLHILIDIPTHSYRFYPTPVFWPLSNWRFDGFSWATPWFLVLNYLAIIIVYLILRRKKDRRRTDVKEENFSAGQ